MDDKGYRLLGADAAAILRTQPVEAGAVRTRRILTADGAKLVRISFDADEAMSEHSAAVPILVQVLDGDMLLEIGDDRVRLGPGAIVHIDARVRHAVTAITAAQLLLTLLASSSPRPAPHLRAATEMPHAGERPTLRLADAGDERAFPELDVREIPRVLRHGAVLGALERIHDGRGVVLVAPHDPLPLLGEVEQRYPGRFRIDYLERGPEAWRLRLTAAAAA